MRWTWFPWTRRAAARKALAAADAQQAREREAARESLAAELRPVELAIYAAVCLGEAAEDLPATPPAELYDRFLAWTRAVSSGAESDPEPTQRNEPGTASRRPCA